MEIWSWTQTWDQIQDHSCMVFVLSQTREHVDSVLTQTWHSSGLGLYSDLNELVSVTMLASGTGLRTARWAFLTNCVVSQMKQSAGNMSAWHLSFLHASALVPSGVFFVIFGAWQRSFPLTWQNFHLWVNYYGFGLLVCRENNSVNLYSIRCSFVGMLSTVKLNSS